MGGGGVGDGNVSSTTRGRHYSGAVANPAPEQMSHDHVLVRYCIPRTNTLVRELSKIQTAENSPPRTVGSAAQYSLPKLSK